MKLIRVCAVTGFGLLSGCRETWADNFAFVENGAAACALVALEGVKRTHLDFFTNAVFRCTGAMLEIRNEELGIGNDGNVILFSVEKRPIETDDSYEVTFPDAHTLRITCSALSARWALNRILEDAFGVCFCLPGQSGTHYPQQMTVTIPTTPRSDRPSFPFCRQAISGRMEPEWKLALNDRFAGDRVPVATHQLLNIFKDPKFKDPAWVAKLMPEIKGVRKYPASIARCWEPCFACEEGVDEAVKYIAQDLRRHPHWKTYSLGVNDVGGFCECDGCKAMNGGSLTNRCHFDAAFYNYSNAYFKWANKIAAKLEKEFPDVKIGCEGYRELIDPPDFKLHRNIIPYFCAETLQGSSPHVWARREELFAAWSKVCSSFGLSDWNYGNFYLVPRVYNHLFLKTLRFRKQFPQFKGYMAECGDPWKEGPKYWLMHKLLWNVDLDIDAAISVWCRACAGEAAAPHLKRYFEIWEEFWTGDRLKESGWWKSGVDNIYFNFFNDSYLFALEPTRLESAEAELAKALAAAETDGTDDQKTRMRELAVWQRHMIAAAYESGVGATDAGQIRTEADVAKFRANFPRMQKAHEEVLATHDQITSFVRRDVGDYQDNPVWRPQLALQMSDIARGRRIDNRIRVINRYLERDNAAADPAGANLVAADVTLKGVNAKIEQVKSVNGSPRWKVTATDSRGVAISFVQKPHPTACELFFSARVENAAGRKVAVRASFDSWRTNTDQINTAADGGSLVQTVPPGAAQDIHILASVYKSFWLFPDIKYTLRPELSVGESIYVDSLAVRLPSESCLTCGKSTAGFVEKVDTRIGSQRWQGSCPIGPCLPHGSVNPSPDTLWPYTGCGPAPTSGYKPGDPVVGFSQLHCQGTGGTPTYGLFLVSPTTGAGDREVDLASPFTVKVAQPNLLAGRLEKWGIDVRLAPTAHGAVYEFRKSAVPPSTSNLQPSNFRVVLNVKRKIGLPDANPTATVIHSNNVYTADVGTPGHWVPGGVWAGLYAEEERPDADTIVFRIAVSFRGHPKAQEYFDAELREQSVDAVADAAARAWNEKLGTIQLVGASADEERRFYTHFYHTFTQPRDRTDDFYGWAKGTPVWDDHYTVWDTWKTLFPLMGITDPAALASVVNSFSARAEKSGFCASCLIAGQEYRVGQGGDDVDNVVADAIVKGIPGIDRAAAWKLLEQHASVRTRAYRRKGYVEECRNDGYCGRMHSGSSTLAFAYNDFCASEVAALLGKTREAAALRARSANWTNVWNDAMTDAASGVTGFVWGRDAKGGWDMIDEWDGSVVPMRPEKGYNFAFYEGTPWEYSFNVWHDLPGLIAKMDGREKFVARLEYALEHRHIDFGNEPNFMTPWLFDFAGRPDLTAKWAPRVRALFPADGCPGDDDSGAMGSLYVFLTAGFFPIAGQDLYALHGPMVPEVRFNQPNGKTFVVRRAGTDSVWRSVTLNGKPLDHPFLRHADITAGGELVFGEQ